MLGNSGLVEVGFASGAPTTSHAPSSLTETLAPNWMPSVAVSVVIAPNEVARSGLSVAI